MNKEYCYQVSTPASFPRRYLCGPCGGAENQPSEILHIARVLNELNRQTVSMTPKLIDFCKRWATKRNAEASHLKSQRVEQVEDDWTIHYIGVRGEVAYCIWRGLPVELTINNFRNADFPGNIEVRTRTKWWHDLKVRPDDDDQRRVVLAISSDEKSVFLAGWIYAEEGKKVGAKIDPHNANRMFYAVPQNKLQPMSALK